MVSALRALPLLAWLVVGCGSSSTVPGELPAFSVEECEARGLGVGDPGDGRTHRPDYRCPDGARPLASVPSGIEGSVCCPR